MRGIDDGSEPTRPIANTAGKSAVIGAETAGRAELRPLALLTYAASTIAMLGSAAMSPVLPVMMTELELTGSQVGLMMTLFTLPVVFTVPVLGWLADRVGRRPVLSGSLFLFGLSGTAVFFVTDFRIILALRVLQGVGFGGIVPLVVTLLGDMFEGADGVGAQGMRVTFVNLGGFAFPIITGYLVTVAWNVPFLLFAVAIPAGLATLHWLPEQRGAAAPPDRYASAVLAAARTPSVASALALGFARFFSLYGLYTFVPLLVVARGLPPSHAGLIVGTINGTKMLIATQSRRSLAVGTPRTTMVASFFGSALVVGTFLVAESLAVFLLVAALFGAFEGVTAPLQKTVLTRHAAAQVRAGIVSFNAVVQNVGKTLGPLVLGVVVTAFSLSHAFVVLGVLGVGAASLVAVCLFGVDDGTLEPGRAD